MILTVLNHEGHEEARSRFSVLTAQFVFRFGSRFNVSDVRRVRGIEHGTGPEREHERRSEK
jgi:hypothetical protein